MIPTSYSLLGQLQASEEPAWQRFTDLYGPLFRGWLRRAGIRPGDADDLAQDVITVVLRRLPDFQHNGRTGAFRAWLRTICVNCCRDFARSARGRPAVVGGTDFDSYLDRLADPNDDLAQQWEREHDLVITRRLLDTIEREFEPRTWVAFRRVAIQGERASDVAQDLEMTPNAVLIAKSRILARLRELAAGILD